MRRPAHFRDPNRLCTVSMRRHQPLELVEDSRRTVLRRIRPAVRMDVHDVTTALRPGLVGAVDVAEVTARRAAKSDASRRIGRLDLLVGHTQHLHVRSRIRIRPEAGMVLFVPDFIDGNAALEVTRRLADEQPPFGHVLLDRTSPGRRIVENGQDGQAGGGGIVDNGIASLPVDGRVLGFLTPAPVEIAPHRIEF